MVCSLCGEFILNGSVWFQILVHEGIEDSDVTYGQICSLGCLTDYVAKVHAMEIADAD